MKTIDILWTPDLTDPDCEQQTVGQVTIHEFDDPLMSPNLPQLIRTSLAIGLSPFPQFDPSLVRSTEDDAVNAPSRPALEARMDAFERRLSRVVGRLRDSYVRRLSEARELLSEAECDKDTLLELLGERLEDDDD